MTPGKKGTSISISAAGRPPGNVLRAGSEQSPSAANELLALLDLVQALVFPSSPCCPHPTHVASY